METATDTLTTDSKSLGDLGPREAPAWQRWLKWTLLGALVLFALWYWFGRGGPVGPQYVTQELVRGDLTISVTATGNLEPRNQVDVGVELSGTVRNVYVDVNDQVKQGQLLAELDPTKLQAQVLQAQGSLAAAEARVVQSEATAKEGRANYQRLLKVRELSNNKLPSQQDLDVAEATVARAEADTSAYKAAAEQARASLETIQTDLAKTQVRSPINGVVLVRSIEPGQTVAASMTAPVLFTLAEDLKKMELHVLVDEADVGSVKAGQEASFTVDAFPSHRFAADLKQVHFASSNLKSASSSSSANSSSSSATSTGVVTYETVLEVDNSELLLRPGMTATAEIVTNHVSDALLIPNAALRFTPAGYDAFGNPVQEAKTSALSAIMPRMRRGWGSGQQQDNGSKGIGRAWMVENGKPTLVLFHTGVTDGRMTQVLPFEKEPNLARVAQQPEAIERLKQAMQRKLEIGTAVITDTQAAKKP